MAATIECPKFPRSPPLKRAKILMLHGHAESGPKFFAKTCRLEERLRSTFPPAPLPGFLPEFPGGVELFYPTAPLRLTGSEITSHRGDAGVLDANEEKDLDAWGYGIKDIRIPDEIQALDRSVAIMLEFMKVHGPFVGAIGFSCGATVTALLASLLEGSRRVDGWSSDTFGHPSLRFAICYSGFMLKSSIFRPCYYPSIQTPILHVIGTFDPMIDQSLSLDLAKRCSNGRVLYHSGSHYVSMKKSHVKRVVDFIDSKLGSGEEEDDSDWVDI